MRADGSERREVYATSPAPAGISVLRWSPSGDALLFHLRPSQSTQAAVDGLEIMVVSALGGAPHGLGFRMLGYLSDFMDSSPSRDLLAVVEGNRRDTWMNKRVALLDLGSGLLTNLTPAGTTAQSPAWSPDGRLIAYIQAPDAGDLVGGQPARDAMMQRSIWLVTPDGSARRQLSSDDAYRDERPQWSGDGSTILFARLDLEGESASLWLVPASGGAPILAVSGINHPTLNKGAPMWFGYYGHLAWEAYFDWWRP